MAFHVPEINRLRTHPTLGTDSSYGNNGFFILHRGGREIHVQASDGQDWDEGIMGTLRWEHVSVSLENRCPTWEEMSWIKNQFWDKEDCVVQFHPPKSAYVNRHPYCLHLWRPVGIDMPMPPSICVG